MESDEDEERRLIEAQTRDVEVSVEERERIVRAGQLCARVGVYQCVDME